VWFFAAAGAVVHPGAPTKTLRPLARAAKRQAFATCHMLSGLLLMAGLSIGLVALFSDGTPRHGPWLVYAWVMSQTVGVDGQLVGAWYRVSVAVSRRRWGMAAAFALLGLLLAYVGYVAVLVFATQQAYRLTTAQALSHLGMDATTWLRQRAFVSVLLACLSGYLRYRAPRRHTPSLEPTFRTSLCWFLAVSRPAAERVAPALCASTRQPQRGVKVGPQAS
jgi:hypothetical protein